MHFYTYFDKNYLPRALALYDSLKNHCASFQLIALCLDNETFSFLKKLNHKEIILVALDDLEKYDRELKLVKNTRSKIEYYFTISPCLPLFIFHKFPSIEILNYVDADLYFFSSPKPIIEELGSNSILIIPHNFSAKNQHMEEYGKFNVGYIAFRNDSNGISCLKWWREKCLEWCYNYKESKRYADQKYLDYWPNKFNGVVISKNKGLNVAPYNVDNFHFSYRDKVILIDYTPLVFYHFHALKKINSNIFLFNLIDTASYKNSVLVEQIYTPYIARLNTVKRQYNLKFGISRYGKSSLSIMETLKLFIRDYPFISTRNYKGIIHLNPLDLIK